MIAASPFERRQLSAISAVLDHHSLEITAGDVAALASAAAIIPPRTRISITFLPGEELPARIDAAVAVRRHGFVPVPHISARRLKSALELEHFVRSLVTDAGVDRVFVIAGDLPAPVGPYEDALAVISSGVLARHGVRHVGIAGYPEGHPAIAEARLWEAMHDKLTRAMQDGHELSIMTQFGFAAAPVVRWLDDLRGRGIDAPVRVGVAGPASVKTLLRFAVHCGVGASAKVLAKYGMALSNLLSPAGPDRLVADLAAQIDPARHGDVSVHLFPFGGLARTANWARDFQAAH